MPEKSKRARLFSRVGETRGAEFEIRGAPSHPVTIGRNPGNTVVLEPSLVSSRHAQILWDSEYGGFVLEDLDSLNGTALDGHRVVGSERLRHLHVITFAGKHDFIFQDMDRCADRRSGRRLVSEEAMPPPEAPDPVADESEPPREVTGVEQVPAMMPGFLKDGAADEEPPREVTGIEKAPAKMPSFLKEGTSLDEPPREVTGIEKIPAVMPSVLGDRDKGTAGQTVKKQPVETLELEDVDLPSAAGLLAEDPPDEVLDLMAGGSGEVTFCLEFAAAGGGFQNVELDDGENVLGRGVDARIKPDSLDISRRHAILTVAEGRVTVRDLGSRNHTFVGDEKIDDEVEIKVGARLRFGGVEARLVLAEKD